MIDVGKRLRRYRAHDRLVQDRERYKEEVRVKREALQKYERDQQALKAERQKQHPQEGADTALLH